MMSLRQDLGQPLSDEQLAQFAHLAAAFVAYTGAEGIAYDIGMKHRATSCAACPARGTGGAPAIFADQVARVGHSTGFIGAVGKDDFGKCLLSRFEGDGVDTSQVAEIEGLSTGVGLRSANSLVRESCGARSRSWGTTCGASIT